MLCLATAPFVLSAGLAWHRWWTGCWAASSTRPCSASRRASSRTPTTQRRRRLRLRLPPLHRRALPHDRRVSVLSIYLLFFLLLLEEKKQRKIRARWRVVVEGGGSAPGASARREFGGSDHCPVSAPRWTRAGVEQYTAMLQGFSDKHGPQFEPCDLPKTMAKTGKKFHK